MTTCLVALGSNLGDRASLLERAVNLLRSHPQIDDITTSRWRETAPVGNPDASGAFLNGALRLDTSLSATELLAVLLQTEDALGRKRDVRWGARTIDLDLLLYGEAIIESPRLKVPHPWLAVRRFVLEPAVEVAPQLVHPQIGWTMEQLLAHLTTAPDCVALAAAPPCRLPEIVAGIETHSGWKRRPADAGDRRTGRPEIDEHTIYLSRSDGCGTDAPPLKLILLLESPRTVSSSRTAVAARLHRWATRPGRGPFLVLAAEPRDRAVAEVLAALESMD